MENYYQILDSKKVGEQVSISTVNSLYTFTKIGEHRYLVEKCVLVLGTEWETLSGTMTTMSASIMYKKILFEKKFCCLV